MITSRDFQEIADKLSSDKAKAREEGIKLLCTWLEGERSVMFCRFLGKNTAKLDSNDIPGSDTWPYLVILLISCIKLEISTSKRRPPKINLAKSLRAVIQRAEDAKFSGKVLPLLSVVKRLFRHVFDVLSNVPSFQSEYGIILRDLLAVRGYCFHMGKCIYRNLMCLYMEKVESNLEEKNNSQYSQKEEVFRCILTLQSLLENAPGDFPETLREGIVKGFIRIFSFLRDEGKISRKLMDCVNTYLLKDGPNLGCQSLEIHDSMQHFVYRCWLTTHDRGLKDALILYARLQLNLTRDVSEASSLVEQLLDLVCKELDQSSLPGAGVPRNDGTKDDKFGTLNSSQCGLVELAALVFYRACVHMTKAPSTEKRAKREHASHLLKEALMKGKWLWHAVFRCLICNYYTCISEDLFIYWFEGIYTNFERILNDANMRHAYDGLLWTLRSLQELSSALLLPNSPVEIPSSSSFSPNKFDCGWQMIWNCLMHGLPIFSNLTTVVEAALVLLGRILSCDSINTCFVPQDVWDLQLFKQMPSTSALYFIACYFSRKGSQGDHRDIFHLRKNLLRATLGYLDYKEDSTLNECLVLLLPAAIYALCAGCSPFTNYHGGNFLSYSFLDVTDIGDDRFKIDECEHKRQLDPFKCFVEVLAKFDLGSSSKVFSSYCHQSVCLPQQLRDPLLHEMENYILGAVLNKNTKQKPLSEVFIMCALLSNIMYGLFLTRKREVSLFLSKVGHCLLELIDHSVDLIQENYSDVQSLGCFGSNSDFNERSFLVSSLRSFICSPVFVQWRDQDVLDATLYDGLIQAIERVLTSLTRLYEKYSDCISNTQSETILSEVSVSDTQLQRSCKLNSNRNRIVDVELDVNEDTRNVNSLTVNGNFAAGMSYSAVKWKLEIIFLISSFFSVLHVTWDILFELMEKECSPEVREKILYYLCQHPSWSSSTKIIDLVKIMDNMIKMQVSLKLDCAHILTAIHGLLGTLLLFETAERDKKYAVQSLRERVPEQCLIHLGDLLNKVAEYDLLDWSGRVKLIDCMCNFISLTPHIGQSMIERLLLMLQDPDYRVRLFLGRRIGVLFQTWDGHEELFQDICNNFGAILVVHSKEKLVNAKEALAAGPQPRPKLETIIISLMHIALHSDKIELEAVFMMSVVSAIDPCQRDLVNVALDNLSQQLQYATRWKYFEEIFGSILFWWVDCGVSLVALVEIRRLFVSDAEPSYFMQYCCHWLLPALVLHGENSDLKWVAEIAGQPLAELVKNHFVPIFSVSMALHCSERPGNEMAAMVLQSSILHLAEISEDERDKLIKKHMVSIVNHILSLASSAPEPAVPFFSRDTIIHAIQTVVDGFLEMDDYARSAGVIDKINIFRPDRVFMFIVEMHYKISAAVHHRHKCHRLAGIEVLINILGHRAAVSSTSNYLFNLIGQFIGCHALQDQCCRIISALLKPFKNNPSKEIIHVLGEQLQFLVSKLVACCIPSDASAVPSSSRSSQVLSLLLQLTVDSDPSLYDYVRELEPFPEIDIFDGLRNFHEKLCQAYSARDHLLKVICLSILLWLYCHLGNLDIFTNFHLVLWFSAFQFVKRSCYLPSRILSWSLQALHKKLLMNEISQREKKAEDVVDWHSDHEIIYAVWSLVRMCGSDDANGIRALVSDFVSRVGIGDPHCVVFHLPRDSSHMQSSQPINNGSTTEINFHTDAVLSEELLISLLKVLKKYLMDDSVKIVDMTSQTLRGILSTERGQRAIMSFDSYERSLLEVHSKGVNIDLVEKFLLDLERKSKVDVVSLENSAVWETENKTFEMWICPLVHSLIGYCDDVILRLFQDIVLLKSEVAELLLPSVFVNLAGRKATDIDLQKLISLQVQEHILVESNKLIKSIQVFLNSLYELRLCHVMERSSLVQLKQEHSKYSKPSSGGSKSHSTSKKARDRAASSNVANITSVWDKVYWLSIDYLVVAKSAVISGSYFTALMYVEHWCEEHFKSLTLGRPDFSHLETLPHHVEILVSAITQINEPDSLYGVIQSHKLSSQIVTLEHEGNWSKALEYYELQVRSDSMVQLNGGSRALSPFMQPTMHLSLPENDVKERKPYKGLIRSLQKIGCMHVLDMYCQGLTSRKGQFQHDLEFTELQYEAAWRAGNWDFSLVCDGVYSSSVQHIKINHFNENLHSCLRAFQEGDSAEFFGKLRDSKQELLLSVSHASEESTEYIYSTIIKLQILYHLGVAWDIRWKPSSERIKFYPEKQKLIPEPVIPTMNQLSWLNMDWSSILDRTQLHMNLLEPFTAFRRVLLQILGCKECTMQHLLQSASTLRKNSRFSLAAAALHEFKLLCTGPGEQFSTLYGLGRLEEAKLLRAQDQHEMAINLAKYISENYQLNEEASDVHRLVGKWLAETRSSNSRTILEKYLKHAVSLAEGQGTANKKSIERQCQTHFHLAHYADALFRNYEERLASNEWQAALRLRNHKTRELEALIRRLKSAKGDKVDYSVKIQELQKQLAMDKEEAEKLQDDRDNFLGLALEGYERCLVIDDKYDVRVVFRLVSLWFSLSSRQNVIDSMLQTINEVQSYKFIPLVYQIASRMGSSKDGPGPQNFQFALVSLVKKMSIDHPYHTIFQILALANGDRIKDKQRSRNSFVVDMDKKLAAENLLEELSSYHGPIIRQMKTMVEIYIKLAELETRREDTNRRITLPRDIRNLRRLELVPVVTANVPVDRTCQYNEGSFPCFNGLADSIMVMNGVNAPKVVECFGSDGHKYRQLAKSGNDDLRQDAVMEQFFGLVNTFLQNHQDTWKRRLGVRTYKVVPFTPSAGVLEWVDGTLPLGEYLIGRNGGAHGCYGVGDWTFMKCREHMSNEKDKRKAFQQVCENFRPVMHYFFLERFLQPADWFEKRLAYTRSVAASSMVGYIVGLGDRHSMNILIDQVTAEVVHIDLGVAFEQGLMLKTPERVPFRLTRDIIDGMGVTGVEGVFRRCCEKTLSVMRTNKEALLTIIEVFIHDPLYKWALSPLKALQRQKELDDDLETSLEGTEGEHEGNKDATRALMRVKQKLDGYEDGEMRSVHGQVQQLIQDAINPERLCLMFPGWGAWL
ncbi:serine/threonine-protein kinase ATM isoform X3 [Mangifera indica]|uniref:serine/threonine-protein kinase ATM isoform X3 n=1 Tax=Mangifera indica TaxID=29780 RepID=UPI001CFAA69A|nr:serine/threonine-protein kinase ATM isoform X3 [Mangifera indica]